MMRFLKLVRAVGGLSPVKWKFIPSWILLIFFLPAAIHSQLIHSYQNPPDIRWKKIETPHFEIVFPQEISNEALRVADRMEILYGPLSKTLSVNRKPFTLVLSNQGAVANGYVTLAPRKSEWYHQPSQGTFTGSGEWFNLLAVHEGRHMVQFDKVNTGFTRFAGWLLGETGVLGLSMFSIPLWWWEGDAVGMETALTSSGRGRVPEFSMGIRTLLLNKTRYSYPKTFLGSYRDWTPNWYELGYQLVSHVKQQYGPDAWGRVIRRTSKWSFWPFSFSNALKKETGKGLTNLYKETLSELEGAWKTQSNGVRIFPYRTLNREPSAWTKYGFPQYLSDGSVLAQKYGFDTPRSLVILDENGKEKTLKQIFPLEPGATRCSTAAGKIVWDEAVPDLRWGMRSFSSLVVMDIRTRTTRRIIGKCRYFSPSLSPDGKNIAAVEFETDRTCALVVLDAETGRLVKRILSPDNALLQSPAWSPDGARIVFTFQKYDGKGVSVLDTASDLIRIVLSPGWEGISNPILFARYVVFSSPKSGIDNIHAVDLETGTEYQITSVPYGAFAPQVSPDCKRLLFASYSPKGMAVCETDFDPSLWIRADFSAPDQAGYAATLAAQEGGAIPDSTQIPNREYPIEDYKPFSHLLNVHSWFPVTDSQQFGLMFQSKNILNTMALSVGPMVNTNENKGRFEAKGTYAGLFPMVDFGVSHGSRGAEYEIGNGQKIKDNWTETSANLGMRIPLDLSRGVYYTRLQAGFGALFTHVSGKSIRVWDENFNGNLIPFHYRLEFSSFRDGTIRDVSPRRGLVFQIEYRHTPFKSDYRGSQFFSQAIFYLPGLINHHGLQFRMAWEEQKPDPYLFSSSFPFSRGYDSVFHERFAYASASYAFPMFYPDFALGPLAYLKRVKGRLFYDYTLGIEGNVRDSYRSAGVEMAFETNFFNLPFPIDLGIRWVRRIKDRQSRIEIFVGFDLESIVSIF